MQTVSAHTADLGSDRLADVREFCFRVFEDNYNEDAWDHTLGGEHVLLLDDEGRIAAHGAVVGRRILHGGRALRTGYVESVAVSPEHQRQGLGRRVMGEVERLICGGYRLGGLAASPAGEPLYEALGWRRWTGPLHALHPDGTRPTPEETAVFVLPVDVTLDADQPLVADWRDGSVW